MPQARVLVVDDDPLVRRFVCAVLVSAQYEIDEVDDGARAPSRVAQWCPDLVITDLVMPEQEGIGLIRALRKAYPALAIIAMSGARGGSYLPVAKVMGANATLAKPFDRDALLTHVRQALATGTAA